MDDNQESMNLANAHLKAGFEAYDREDYIMAEINLHSALAIDPDIEIPNHMRVTLAFYHIEDAIADAELGIENTFSIERARDFVEGMRYRVSDDFETTLGRLMVKFHANRAGFYAEIGNYNTAMASIRTAAEMGLQYGLNIGPGLFEAVESVARRRSDENETNREFDRIISRNGLNWTVIDGKLPE